MFPSFGRFPLSRHHRILWLTLFVVLFSSSPASVFAQDGANRPYIELPFPRDSRYTVTCGYSCYQHRGSMTYAVDFRVPEGDPIVAAAGGEVIAVTWEIGLPANLDLGDALIVYIDHGDEWFTRYVHLEGVTVEVGDQVAMGDVIGYSGKTGTAGAHLHFELKHGSSLHSPSVPINELFDGNDPVEAQSYLSNNRTLTKSEEETPLVEERVPLTTPTAAPVAATSSTPTNSTAPALPLVTQSLILSSETFTVGQPFQATFTLKNNTNSRLHLAMLGVAGRDVGESSLRADLLFFDRSLVLNPGRDYQFTRTITINQEGTAELFPFALGLDNEWVPLSGVTASVIINVVPPAQNYHVYLPTLSSGYVPEGTAQDASDPAAVTPTVTTTATPETTATPRPTSVPLWDDPDLHLERHQVNLLP